MKLKICNWFVAVIFILGLPAMSNANIIGVGHIYDSALGGIIDDWFFTATTAGNVSISVNAIGVGDPEINFFVDDGSLSSDDFRDNDDDGGGGLNSYLFANVNAGSYLLRVSEYDFGNAIGSNDEILGAYNDDVTGDFYYNLEITGSAELVLVSGPDVDPVPEPATMFLLGTGLVGVAGAARRKKKKLV